MQLSTDPGPAQPPAIPVAPRSWAYQLLAAGLRPFTAFAAIVLLGFAAAAGALWLFAVIADEVAGDESAAIDAAATAWVRANPSPQLDVAARLVSALGSEVLAVAAVVLVGLYAWRRHWRSAVIVVVTLAGAQLLNDLLKQSFHRSRPVPIAGFIPAQAYSFPSGHAMMSAAFYLLLVCLLWNALDWRWRPLLVGAAVALVLAIDLTRLYLQAHYLTDVIAGNAAGLLWTDAVLLGGELLRGRRRPTGAPPRMSGAAPAS